MAYIVLPNLVSIYPIKLISVTPILSQPCFLNFRFNNPSYTLKLVAGNSFSLSRIFALLIISLPGVLPVFFALCVPFHALVLNDVLETL